jgi:hypothetical protein
MAAIENELWEQIRKLDKEQQRQVFDFVRRLARPKGEPVEGFLQRTAVIHIPEQDLEEMGRFIEEEFERIDWDDWNNPPALSA